MKKRIYVKLIIAIFFSNFTVAQSNQYPTMGDVTIRSYSPRLILQRSENIGGFISGIQTKLFNGTDNWYFGSWNEDLWVVSKGSFENPLFTVITNGNVGIGTITPTSKLTVAGNINSREVKVSVDAGADFVFDNTYNLPSLDFIRKYINENKHLPEIESAQEMQKDGINLSEMNIKLLQKIEELTLYLIDQNKKIETQEKEITALKDLVLRLDKIEANFTQK